MKKLNMKLERETLKETFYAIQKEIPPKKRSNYDGRLVRLKKYTFEDFSSRVLDRLKEEEIWIKFYKLKTNIEKIYMFVENSRNAYALTYRLNDIYIVEKEMLAVIEGRVTGGHLIKLKKNSK